MAYGIIVDGTKKGCIGDIGIYHYCDEGVEYEGHDLNFIDVEFHMMIMMDI